VSERPIACGVRQERRGVSPAQRGSALVLAIFVLVVLTGMGTALLFLSQSEVKMGQASLRAKQAFYIAEAGLESARLTLYDRNRGEPFDDDLQRAAGGGASPVMDFDPDLVEPVYDGNGNITGFTGYGDDEPLVDTAAFGNGWHIAFLTNDPVDGRTSLVDSNERVMITSFGGGPDRSFEVVQAIVELREIFPSAPPATITILGPDPVFHGGSSAAKQFIGNDCNGSGIPGFYAPVIGVIGPSGAADPCPPLGNSVTCGIIKPNTYKTGYGTYVGNDTAEDVTDAGVYGSVGPIDPSWLNCQNLVDLGEQVREAADVICAPAAACVFPPNDPARVIYIEGDFVLGPTLSGDGLLWITGELEMHGQTAWNGMIYVVGEGIYIRKGAGNGPVSGALFVADIAGPDDIYGTADDCTGGDGGFHPAVFDESGGGTGDEIYCTNHINPALPIKPYEVVDFLQR
jgi:hypothetical protein